MARIRVALIEDNERFRDEMIALLASAPSLEIVGCYATGEEALHGVDTIHPDIVLVDLGLPGVSGVEVMHHILAHVHGAECVALTAYEDDDHLFAALQAGAVGYIVKTEISLAEIVRLIADVRNGGAPMSLGIARRVLQEFRKNPRPLEQSAEIQKLTTREKEILEHRVQGFPTKKVAEQLHISYETVRLHQKHIYKKLQVKSMVEAVAMWRKEKRD